MKYQKENNEKNDNITSEAVVSVGGTSSIGRHVPLTCRPGASLPRPSFPSRFRPPRFPSYSYLLPSAAPPRSLGRASSDCLLLLPTRTPLAPTIADARRCLLSCASSSRHVTTNRLAASRPPPPRTASPPSFLAAADHGAVSTSNIKEESSVKSLVARNSPKTFDCAHMPRLELPTRSRVLPTSHSPYHYPIRVDLKRGVLFSFFQYFPEILVFSYSKKPRDSNFSGKY